MGAPRILVLEDEVAIRKMLDVVLRERGYEVAVVGTAAEARAASAEQAFDLLVLDKNLPDGDGVALAGELGAGPGGPEAIIITAYPSLGSAVEAIKARTVVDYLPKPFDLTILTSRIELALDRRARREENRKLGESVAALADHLAQVLGASFDPIVTLEADGTVLRWNRGAERVYGWGFDSVQGKPLSLIETDPQAEVTRRLHALRGDPIVNEELVRRTREGEERHVLVTLTAVGKRGAHPRTLVEVSKDVTAQKAMQRELLHADRLKTLGTLAAGLAHEVNNPLAFVKANLTLLGEKMGTRDEETGELVRECLDGVARIANTVRHLRGFSRSATDRPVETPLREVVDGAVTLAHFRARDRKHPIEVEMAEMPDVPCMPARLGQAIVNLLVNALDASGPKGRVSLRATAERGEAVVEVRDDGPGIPPEIQGRIFEPFFSTKSPGEGTGLGLGICRQIVQEHGGRLYFRTASGAGTSFFLRLPFFDPTRYRLLVVDDEELVRRALRRLFESARYVVEEASQVPDALHVLETAKVHLVVADYHMPGATGLDLLAEMFRRWPATRRIVLTASEGMVANPDVFAPVHPFAVLAKPWDDSSLLATIRAALLLL